MTNESQHSTGPRHAKKTGGAARKILRALLLVCLFLGLVAGMYYAYGKGFFSGVFKGSETSASFTSSAAFVEETSFDSSLEDATSKQDSLNFSDRSLSYAQQKADEQRQKEEGEQKRLEEEKKAGNPTPLIANYGDVLIHSPIRAQELEGILFHQAATEYGLVLETQLAEADPDAMLENPNYEIADDQPTGDEWLRAKALHLWRVDTPTDMDTSIDVGAEANTQVYAPVTGTVVLVRTYSLYDVVDDYEVHIQPDGHPELDVVEIHIQDVSVKAGDKVVGGLTPIALVRDLAAEDITDIQLAFYSKEGHGNHTHVQVNNADAPEYRETRLKDAYKVE